MSRKLVLIVDDDHDLRSVLALYLELQGFAVMTASNGREGLTCVDQERPAAILLDMRMPIMDGWAFARELRAKFERTIPIIVMTAAADAKQRALEVQAESFLSKPFDPEDLHQIVNRIVSAPETV